MDSDQKISTSPILPTPPLPPKLITPPVPDLQTPRVGTALSITEETPEPIAMPVISRSTPLAEGLSAKNLVSTPLSSSSLPPTPPLPSKQPIISPAPKIPSPPTIPKTPSTQSANDIINLNEELAPKTLKYSIRTMAQDLERAKKEGISPEFAAKIPTMPPPPPLRVTTPRETIKAPFPIAPTIKTVEVSPALTPLPSTPFAMPSARPGVIPPPTQKPSRISFAHLNLIVIIASVVIVFIGSLGFSYWWFFVREAPITPIVEQPPIEEELPPPVVEEPTLPEKIVLTDQDIIIDISEKSPSKTLTASLFSQISESAKILDDKKLARVLIKYSSETEKYYLSFTESLAILDMSTPDSFIENMLGGEILAYNQNSETRYGFAAKIVNAVRMIDIMKDWENTVIDDLKNIYIEKTPVKPEGATFKDFSYESFISRYLSLPTPDISMTWGVSDTEKIFVITTSKDMLYKIIGYKETEKPVLRTFPSGTLVRAEGDTKIYRIIDDKKLWVPTVKAFIDSGYPIRSEIDILPEELAQYPDARYIKLKDAADIYEIKDVKKYIVANPQTLSQNEIKTATYAEFIAYPIGQ